MFRPLSSTDDDDDDDLDEAQIQRRRDLMRQRALARAQVTPSLIEEYIEMALSKFNLVSDFRLEWDKRRYWPKRTKSLPVKVRKRRPRRKKPQIQTRKRAQDSNPSSLEKK